MMTLKNLSVLCGVLLFAAALNAPQAMSDEWNKKTIVTVNEPLQIPGVTLQPGKYVFKLADSLSNRHIVQVFNDDQSHILATILAIPNERLEPANGTVLQLWETPKGAPHALRAWFYPGDTIGQEFRYPKEEAAALTAEVHQEVPALTEEDQAALTKHGSEMPSNSTESAAAQQQPSSTASASSEMETTRELPRAESTETAPAQPSVTDQNQVSQSADTQAQSDIQEQHSAASSEASEPARSRELPHTASYLPLLGLGGLVALGAASVLRISIR